MSWTDLKERTQRAYEDFNPFDIAFRNDPRSFYPQLLEASPGFIEMEGVPSAYVAKYEHVTAVMRDFKRFSSVKPKGLPGMEKVDYFNSQPVMNYSDPPQHQRLRRVVNAVFQPKRIAQMADLMEDIIHDLLADVKRGDTVDVMQTLTKPLTNRLLLGGLLGIAEEDRHIMLDLIAASRFLDNLRPGEAKPAEYLERWQAGVDYCNERVARAKVEPGEDIISLIAMANEEGGLTDQEMMAMVVLLYIGGNTSVPTAAGTSLISMAQHREVAERVRQDPVVAKNVLEESLRLNPSVLCVMRFAVEDVVIGGSTIPADMPVYTLLSSACHDPDMFPDPYRFDIDRDNTKNHVVFGYGIHTCIGNAITRTTVPMLINEIVNRYPDLSCPDPTKIKWGGGVRSRHLLSLEMSF
jgi:cytochrome P450